MTILELAKNIFDSRGCEVDRCKWGDRPCCCQDFAWKAANAALPFLQITGTEKVK